MREGLNSCYFPEGGSVISTEKKFQCCFEGKSMGMKGAPFRRDWLLTVTKELNCLQIRRFFIQSSLADVRHRVATAKESLD